MNRVQDKQRGCLLGLALCDALSAAVEFKSPGSFEPVTYDELCGQDFECSNLGKI
jgi:ADP-ribosylglycohydrolase